MRFVCSSCIGICGFSGNHGQQKEGSSIFQLWQFGFLVLVVPTAASQGPDCGGAPTLVVRDLHGALQCSGQLLVSGVQSGWTL